MRFEILKVIASVPASVDIGGYELGSCGNTVSISYKVNDSLHITALGLLSGAVRLNTSIPIDAWDVQGVGVCASRIFLANCTGRGMLLVLDRSGNVLRRIPGYSSWMLKTSTKRQLVLGIRPLMDRKGCAVTLLYATNLTKIMSVVVNGRSCSHMQVVWADGEDIAFVTRRSLVVVNTTSRRILLTHALGINGSSTFVSDVLLFRGRLYVLYYKLVSPSSVEFSVAELQPPYTSPETGPSAASSMPALRLSAVPLPPLPPRLFVYKGKVYLYTIVGGDNESLRLVICEITGHRIERVYAQQLPLRVPSYMQVFATTPMWVHMPRPVDVDHDGKLELPIALLSPVGGVAEVLSGAAKARVVLLLAKIWS